VRSPRVRAPRVRRGIAARLCGRSELSPEIARRRLVTDALERTVSEPTYVDRARSIRPHATSSSGLPRQTRADSRGHVQTQRRQQRRSVAIFGGAIFLRAPRLLFLSATASNYRRRPAHGVDNGRINSGRSNSRSTSSRSSTRKPLHRPPGGGVPSGLRPPFLNPAAVGAPSPAAWLSRPPPTTITDHGVDDAPLGGRRPCGAGVPAAARRARRRYADRVVLARKKIPLLRGRAELTPPAAGFLAGPPRRGRLQLLLPAGHLRRQLRQRLPPYAPRPHLPHAGPHRSVLTLTCLCVFFWLRRVRSGRVRRGLLLDQGLRLLLHQVPVGPVHQPARPDGLQGYARRHATLSKRTRAASRWGRALAALLCVHPTRAACSECAAGYYCGDGLCNSTLHAPRRPAHVRAAPHVAPRLCASLRPRARAQSARSANTAPARAAAPAKSARPATAPTTRARPRRWPARVRAMLASTRTFRACRHADTFAAPRRTLSTTRAQSASRATRA